MDAVLENSTEVTNAINGCVYGLLNLETNDARKQNIFDDKIKESIESLNDNRVVKNNYRENIMPKIYKYTNEITSIFKLLKQFSKDLKSRKYEHVDDVYELNRRIWEYLESYALQLKYIKIIKMFNNDYCNYDSVYSAVDIIKNMDLGNIDENTCQEFVEKRQELTKNYQILYNGLALHFDD